MNLHIANGKLAMGGVWTQRNFGLGGMGCAEEFCVREGFWDV